jgi:hypothetical protein
LSLARLRPSWPRGQLSSLVASRSPPWVYSGEPARSTWIRATSPPAPRHPNALGDHPSTVGEAIRANHFAIATAWPASIAVPSIADSDPRVDHCFVIMAIEYHGSVTHILSIPLVHRHSVHRLPVGGSPGEAYRNGCGASGCRRYGPAKLSISWQISWRPKISQEDL